MSTGCWLFKSEPNAYSYSDLVRDGTAEWDGVRNYQARNFLRDSIQIDDRILFYHSNTSSPSVVGTAIVVNSGYPDSTAWDPNSDHPDPKSTPETPIWYMVDIKPKACFITPVTLLAMRENHNLREMMLLRRGMRLSIQPVTLHEFNTICQMGNEHDISTT